MPLRARTHRHKRKQADEKQSEARYKETIQALPNVQCKINVQELRPPKKSKAGTRYSVKEAASAWRNLRSRSTSAGADTGANGAGANGAGAYGAGTGADVGSCARSDGPGACAMVSGAPVSHSWQ